MTYGVFSADYYEFGNDGQPEKSSLIAAAPTTGKPRDVAEPSTGPGSIGVSSASVDRLRPLPLCRLVA
jgi:hypothetical protein